MNNIISSSKRRYMPIVVLVLGILAIVTFLFTNKINQRMEELYLFDDLNHEVQSAISQSHLWLEEVGDRDPSINNDYVLFNINLSSNMLDAMLYGGRAHGQIIQPLTDTELITKVKAVKSLVIEFKKTAVKWLNVGNRPALDRVHEIYSKFIYETIELDEYFEVLQEQYKVKLNRLFWGILIIWLVIILTTTLGMLAVEVRSKKAEEELVRYREHLEELVEHRTSELSDINKRLNQEIKDKVLTEKTLTQNKEKHQKLSQEFQILLEAIHDPLIMLSHDLRVLWANSATVAMFGKETPELKGLYCYNLCQSHSALSERCPSVRCFRTGKVESELASTSDGRQWEIRVFPIKDKEGKVNNVIETMSDVTEKLKLQAETIRVGQLALLGELAAGVAHEINNPINSIVNFAQILSDKTESGSKEEDFASRIMKEGDRISDIVASLLSFARYNKDEKDAASIQEIISDALTLTGTQMLRDSIALKVDIPPDLPEIMVHYQQIEQVFLNIINNARYALNRKYSETHQNKIFEIQGQEISINDGRYIRITFYDSGTGIPGDIIDKIINPFFTTKPKGSGTGLGLSISHGIINDHGGNFKIDSIEGEYTKVIIDLPMRTIT